MNTKKFLKEYRNFIFSNIKNENLAIGLFILQEFCLEKLRKKHIEYCFLIRENEEMKSKHYLFQENKNLTSLYLKKMLENNNIKVYLINEDEIENLKLSKNFKEKELVFFKIKNNLKQDVVFQSKQNQENYYEIGLQDQYNILNFSSFNEEKYNIFYLIQDYINHSLNNRIPKKTLIKELEEFDKIISKEIRAVENYYHEFVLKNAETQAEGETGSMQGA